MRIVAKVQLTTPSSGGAVQAQVAQVLGRWRERKFVRDEAGASVIRHSGARAEVEVAEETVGERRLERTLVLEPVPGGSLQTDIRVIADAGRTAFRCVLSMESEGGITPTEVSLRPPRFVREIVGLGSPWTIGIAGERVFAQPFFADLDDVDELDALVSAPERRLPIVMVSEFDGETLAGDLHERLSQDLCGLAHTVRLSAEASWELTRRHGREWSCYNGAVRLLWPLRGGPANPFGHPLWTWDQMRARAGGDPMARDRMRGLIARRILEASTFVADDPVFRDFDAAKLRHATEEALQASADDRVFRSLADAYAEDNKALLARVDEQAREIEVLRSNLATLTDQLRFAPTAATAEDPGAPPRTVTEAVAQARARLGGRIVIATETDEDVTELNPLAGPPVKVLRYLATLADMADAMAAGGLGNSVPKWLEERNVDCSIESETAKSNKDAQRFRTRMVDGESVECEFHAKPADATSPDMCVRIYFATSDTAPHVKVGYIGRHDA